MAWVWFHRFGSPPHFYRLAGKLVPWFGWPAALLCLGGLIGGLVMAPPDYQQGDGFRIIYVHAPAAWLSLLVYVVMASSAAVGLIWRMTVAHAVAASCAVIGASFTALALATGMLWGRPMWGTYWEWDPRLTSELLLLFLYLGYMGLRGAMDDVGRADRASAVLAIVGVVNVPIIHYSVIWWNSLHQAPSVMKFGRPTMPAAMLVPLLLMLAGFSAYFFALLLLRARGELLRRERQARWISEALPATTSANVAATGAATATAKAAGAGGAMLKFLAMGGYARYVWPCYALTALVVAVNIHWARASLRAAQAEARRRLASLKVPS